MRKSVQFLPLILLAVGLASCGFEVPVAGKDAIERAVVTAGGVSVRQVDPKTMASKLVPGLYFAGEVLDVDAYTGGFNLQIAFASGYAAGTHIFDDGTGEQQ